MFERCSKTAVTFIGLSVFALLFWGSFSYLVAQGTEDRPKPDKVEVIETLGEPTKKPRADVKDEKNNPKEPEIAKRAGLLTCDVHFDNRTRWRIHRMWVDGQLRARSMQPWGDVYVRDVIIGPTELYAEADFTDGTTLRWGPRTVDCKSYQTFRWRLVDRR